MAEHDVEETWEEFWLPILREAEGDPGVAFVEGDYLSVAMLDQVKRELHDYRRWMRTWAEVADEFSGGRLSKVNYTPDVYLNAFEEAFEERLRESVAEETDLLQITADDAAWQKGYDQAYEEGRAQGRDEGYEDARRMLG